MEEKKVFQFYGGKVGPWIPILFLIVMMVVAVATNYTDWWCFNLITLLAIAIAFLLAKSKKSYGEVAIAGIGDEMMSILVLAFIMAGILSKLLRMSGLIPALVWLLGVINLESGFIPLMGFLIAALISTSCGTSSGSIVAVLPVVLPMAVQLGCNPSLVTGAVISGALFGDNLAPISDTTIASATTQGCTINDVVRTRLPYSLIAGGIASVLFVIFGFITSENVATKIAADEVNLAALSMLIVPVVMIFLMKKGWDLGGTLIVCNILGTILNLVLGLIPASEMFSGEGPLISGINGMIDMIIFCLLFFIVIEGVKASGALEDVTEFLLKHCKGTRSVEIIIMLSSVLGTIVTAGSSTGIVFAGPMANKIATKFGIAGTRVANLLDATACSVCGFVPFCTPYLISIPIGQELAGIPDDYSYFSVVKYVFHPMFLVLVFLGSVITGIGRNRNIKSANQ